MMGPIKGFIFDLDGVLTDTAEYHYRGWKRLADEEGIPFTREDNEVLRGIPRRESLMLILRDRIYPEDRIRQMMEHKKITIWNSSRRSAPRICFLVRSN